LVAREGITGGWIGGDNQQQEGYHRAVEGLLTLLGCLC